MPFCRPHNVQKWQTVLHTKNTHTTDGLKWEREKRGIDQKRIYKERQQQCQMSTIWKWRIFRKNLWHIRSIFSFRTVCFILWDSCWILVFSTQNFFNWNNILRIFYSKCAWKCWTKRNYAPVMFRLDSNKNAYIITYKTLILKSL